MIKSRIFVALSTLIILVSCKEKDSDIGRDLIAEEDLLGATYCDTATVIAYSVIDDSIRTDESYVGSIANLIGTIADPVFGRTDASLFTGLSNANNTTNIGFGINPKLDSVVLGLAYLKDSYYGDKSDPLLFNVYQLNEQVYYDSIYYSHSQIPYNIGNELTYNGTGQTVVLDPSTSVYDGDTKYAPHLRIRLKNEVGQQFIDDTSKLASSTTLRESFKGLCITTKNTAASSTDYGVIGSFDLTSPLSKITIYYHNGTDFTVKRVELVFYGANARFNNYVHDITNASTEYLQQLNGTNITTGDQHLYMQGMANSKVVIKFPYLKNFSDSCKISVSRAELSFTVDQSPTLYDATKFFVPSRVALEGLYNDTTLFPLTLDQSYNFGGEWGTLDEASKEFHFNTAYTIQKIANGDYTNMTYSMRIFQHFNSPYRIVFGGGKNASYPAKLKLWYTKVK